MTDTNVPWNLQDYKELLKLKGRLVPVVQKEMLKDQYRKAQLRDTEFLHPSEISKKHWCHRASVYKINGVPHDPEKFPFTRLNIFEEGNYIHQKWQKWLQKAGILWGIWKCQECENVWYAKSPTQCPSCESHLFVYREVPLRDDEHRIIGHADGEIEDDKGRALIEIKSIGLGTVRMENPSLYSAYESKQLTISQVWDNIKRPFPSHLRQGSIYMHCRKIDTIVFIYEWKPTQQVKEFEVKYQPDFIADILSGCKSVMQALEDGTIPDRPEWATSKSCHACKPCPFSEVCWNNE